MNIGRKNKMGHLTFILGGARSGKSTHALSLARQSGQPVTFIATAQALDAEMQARIAQHRTERPVHWQTLEIPLGLATSLAERPAVNGLYVLDCLTLLVSNVMLTFEETAAAQATQAVEAEILALVNYIQVHPTNWVIISNEVGLGLVPAYPLGRLYREVLGRANQQLAAAATEVIWMVAGIPVPIGQYRITP
jgi:adenosylcobinamide kinase/adenosylcobinamide-phosphate guanylyltransferase